jgi:hypothetical protein
MQSSLPKAAVKLAIILACSVIVASFFRDSLGDITNVSNVVKFEFAQRTSSGEASACEIDFAAIGADSYYKSPPGLVLVSGSWYFMIRDDGNPVASLKMCGMDVVDVESQSLRQFRVEYAYPIFNGTSQHRSESAQKTIEDCAVSAYTDRSLYKLLGLINAADLQIVYTRKVTGQDVHVNFSFNLENYGRSESAIRQWIECATLLAQGSDRVK